MTHKQVITLLLKPEIVKISVLNAYRSYREKKFKKDFNKIFKKAQKN